MTLFLEGRSYRFKKPQKCLSTPAYPCDDTAWQPRPFRGGTCLTVFTIEEAPQKAPTILMMGEYGGEDYYFIHPRPIEFPNKKKSGE